MLAHLHRRNFCLVAAIVTLILGAAVPAASHSAGNKVVAAITGDATPGAFPGGPFALVDHNGRAVTDANFRGRYMLVFFGYTNCPDICPMTLQDVAIALKILGPLAAKVQPLFISVDPEHDTSEVLAEYVGAFDTRIVGLTGTHEQIAQAARAYMAFYRKAPVAAATAGSPPDHQAVEHSAYTYLMGPDGRYLTHFPYNISPEAMAREIRERIGAGS